jgi:alginate O-acetyltransferase complex protein AlgI
MILVQLMHLMFGSRVSRKRVPNVRCAALASRDRRGVATAVRMTAAGCAYPHDQVLDTSAAAERMNEAAGARGRDHMLFHSQIFILGFLPAFLALYYAVAGRPLVREWVMLIGSLIFYGWWDPRFLPLLVGQSTLTWLAAEMHQRTGRRGWLWAGVGMNLLSLAVFKYTTWLIASTAAVLGMALPTPSILLPIGISFFTFQLACYLVDIARGSSHHHPWRRVCLFVSLFPHLVAGPLVRHHEIMPQLDADPLRPGLAERFAKGAAFFAVGLLKKVFLADAVAESSDKVFAAAATGAPSLIDGWHGALAFSLQLLLDFSAYTEMAIGLGLMLGVRFPDNFDAPYRATNLRDFWRRWHMTLSRLIRDYLYIPLGGSRGGTLGYVKATLVTMGLCGLWHGAGATFIIWGLMHGVGLMVCRWWQERGTPLPVPIAWVLTMLFVMIGWVLFRAPDFAVAANMLAGMIGAGAGLAATVAFKWELAAAAVVAMVGPTTREVVEEGWLKPNVYQGALVGVALVAAILAVGKGQPQTFIYFQF